MDCAVVPTRHAGYSLITTTDFFYPLVEDPYDQGRIGCANVLSDLYAMGVTECDTVLMILACSTNMTSEERDVVTELMIRGFDDQCKLADTHVTGGQTVLNPWPIIGGVAESVCKEEEFIEPDGACVGDVLVLTKPLGTQVAVNVRQWYRDSMKKEGEGREKVCSSHFTFWQACVDKLAMTKEDVDAAYETAVESMARLNRNGAKMMMKYKCRGGTDVTGFGFLGHAKNLAENQKNVVSFKLHTLPVIKRMEEVNKEVLNFNLVNGYSAETSGGLLVALPKENAKAFMEELESLDGSKSWIVGEVIESETKDKRDAFIVEEPTIVQV
uniref:Selenide, water dikinase n=1 Tax=Helicotheca tamesis TaxID=374047 RepID=A0A7S2H1K4_9STRA|mmetsp:Transcript_14361/g.19644  ORF Transcript_14361/g.19644 Transcript_14361/m.19644 type:complete len:327 (+) Transcript_14361:328-1308(+)